METVLIFLIVLSLTIEMLTLRTQILLVYTNSEKVNIVMRKNWKLVSLYGLVALIAFPITILSILSGCRNVWEEKLYNSIKNNLYIKEKV